MNKILESSHEGISAAEASVNQIVDIKAEI